MTGLIALILAALAVVQIIALRATVYALEERHNARLSTLENRKPEQGGKGGQVPDWQKPVENFSPAKPETLRPKQVRGREVDEREFEFDVKITV